MRNIYFTQSSAYFIAFMLLFISATISAQTYSGNVFLDHNSDAVKNFLDYGHPVIKISGYDDTNGSGGLDAGDLYMASTLSGVDGNYSLILDAGITSGSDSVSVRRGGDDAEERVSNDAMNLSSSDLELGFEGGTEQLIGMRFEKINIPAGVTITSAKLRFQSKTFEDNTCNLTFKGDLSINSGSFNSLDANISTRTLTTNSISWTPGDWDGLSFYESNDLSLIITELIGQSGWTQNSPITILVNGTGERTAWSKDGSGTAPELIIEYTVSYTGDDFFIVLEEENLLTGSTITLPVAGHYEFDALAGNQTNTDFAFFGETVYCYGFSDGSVESGASLMNRSTGEDLFIGLTGVLNIEAAAFNPRNNILYAATASRLGEINRTTGVYAGLPNSFGTGAHSSGATETFGDVDGLTFDPFNGVLWGSERNNDSLDLLFQVDPTTGLYVPDVFGPGDDYVEIDDATGTIPEDIDDIAINPKTGELFGIANDASLFDYDLLIKINKTTGVATVVDTLKDATGDYIVDVEGLSFTPQGILSAVTGSGDYSANSIFHVDPITAVGTYLGTYGTGGDYESCDCLTISTNSASGRVWNDVNGDEAIQVGESGHPGVTIYIYVDIDNSGTINEADMLADSVETDMNGDWSYQVGANVDLLFAIDTDDLPGAETLTTDNLEIALLATAVGGVTEAANNFGSREEALPVELASFAGSARSCAIQLNWAAFAEEEFGYYELERSSDGAAYNRIHTAFGQERAGLKSYTFTDRLAAPVNYYRLKMIDLDGSFAYSEVVIMRLDCDKFSDIAIFPNPIFAEDKILNIEYFAAAEKAMFVIYDSAGRYIREFIFATLPNINNQAQLDISNLPAGSYTLHQNGNRRGQIFIVLE